MVRLILIYFLVCMTSSLLHAQINIENISFSSGASIAVEGCPDTIIVELNARVLNDTVRYEIMQGGDANTDDYTTTLGNLVSFTNGDLILRFPINHTEDGLTEGAESITFSFVNRSSGDFTPFSYEIYDEMPLDILATQDTLCLRNSTTLTGFGAGMYTWLNEDSAVIAEGGSISYFPENRDTLFIRGKIHDCVKDTFKVFEFYPDELEINAEDTVFVCKPDTVIINANSNNGTVTWTSDVPGILSEATDQSVRVITDVSSYVYAQLDGENCTITDTVYVRVDSLPEFYFLENTPTPDSPCTSYCPGQLVTLTLNTTDPTLYPDAEFMWEPMRGIQEGEEDQNVLIQTEPDTFYYVRTTTNNACISKDSILIPTIDTTIRLNLTDTSVCESDPAQEIQVNILNDPDRLSGIEWSPDDGTLSCTDCLNPVITAERSQEYTVSATIDGCCPSSATIRVQVIRERIPIQAVETCPGEPVNILVDETGLRNPEWIGSNTGFLDCTDCFDNVATVNTTTTFTLMAEDAEGCIYEGQVTVSVLPPAIEINIAPDPGENIGIGGTVLLDVTTTPELDDTTAIFYELNGNLLEARGPLVEVLINQEGPNTIRVFVTDENGCEISETIIINGVAPEIEMPNAFTPDNDGTNDIFRPVITNAEQATALIEEFRIYNRWGELVYQYAEGDAVEGWDGMYQGQLAPPEVYLYQIILRLPNGERESLKGDVTLVR